MPDSAQRISLVTWADKGITQVNHARRLYIGGLGAEFTN
jgi:hypothetical protein